MGNLLIVLLILVVYLIAIVTNPKFDWNYETGEKLLWFSDPFNSFKRKSVTLWKSKKQS